MKRIIATFIITVMAVTFVGNVYAQQLDEQTQQALIDAINDEYKARATYQKIIDTFGEIRPFTNIIKAEETHIKELLPLFEKYGVDVPKDEWYKDVPKYASVQEACKAGVQAEIENAKLYDEFFTFVKEQDIIDVFKALRDASQEKHLPAFQRCVERGDGQGSGRSGQGQGQGKGQGPGQGKGQGK